MTSWQFHSYDAQNPPLCPNNCWMTRYGKRYNWKIEGEPLNFTSESGTRRLLITDFNTDTGEAKG